MNITIDIRKQGNCLYVAFGLVVYAHQILWSSSVNAQINISVGCVVHCNRLCVDAINVPCCIFI